MTTHTLETAEANIDRTVITFDPSGPIRGVRKDGRVDILGMLRLFCPGIVWSGCV
jgi:hypothetical protein